MIDLADRRLPHRIVFFNMLKCPLFFPQPAKALTVSHPVNAYTPTKTSQILCPRDLGAFSSDLSAQTLNIYSAVVVLAANDFSTKSNA